MLNLDSVILRPIINEDLELVRNWRNAQHVRRYMYTDHYITPEEHTQWYKSISERSDGEYFIAECQGRAIGLVNIYDINKRNRTCFWAFYIGETDRPRGVGVIMEIHAIDHMIRAHNVRKICCEVLAFNEAVIRMHKKFGFEEEGRFKAHILKDDAYEDTVRLALFTDKWEKIRARVVGKKAVE